MTLTEEPEGKKAQRWMMRKGGRFFVFSTVLLFAILPTQGTEDGKNSYQVIVEKFFQRMANGKTSEAIVELFRTNPWSAEAREHENRVKDAMQALDRKGGRYITHELLIEKVVVDRFAFLYFFVVYDRQPVRIEFQFYKPKKEWFLLNFGFHTDVGNEIVERVKQDLAIE